ncbi:MAG: rod shape-determining protein MreD [Gammaproteobacteria bacterium]
MSIITSFIIAFILVAIPLPSALGDISIPWVAVVLAYWCANSPEQMSVISAWLVGFVLDISMGAVLGQHALGFALIAYLILVYQHRFKFAPPVQQVLFITLVILLYRTLVWQIYYSLGSVSYSTTYIWSAFFAPIVWVLISITFHNRFPKRSL